MAASGSPGADSINRRKLYLSCDDVEHELPGEQGCEAELRSGVCTWEKDIMCLSG